MDVDDKELITEIKVDYQWKPKVCNVCKVFGHSDATCPILTRNGIWKPKQSAQNVTNDINEKGKAIMTVVELATKEYSNDPKCSYDDQDQAQSDLAEQTIQEDIQVTSIVIIDCHHIVSNPEPVSASNRFSNLEIEGGQLVVELNAQSENLEGKPREPKPLHNGNKKKKLKKKGHTPGLLKMFEHLILRR
ncbi:unnamed protein product [Ilex paraguariensis]|uniref:Zinc knuckle CX2CX4HX4C domain-containing protein n=1 Tax=Ilex paraguariensis TaxID=185542 RepID=A0ABC8T2H8_9AQUA